MSNDIKYEARLRHLRLAPRRVRAVADLVRGQTVLDAQATLFLSKTRGAKALLGLLGSAVANAKQKNPNVTEGDLLVDTITVDQGPPFMKKWRPRAQGRATAIKRLASHVTIKLAENEY
jgi:large subunit ribosomal protein L22